MLLADAIVAGLHGRGRAVAFGVDPLGRPETTPILLEAIRWTAQQEARGAVRGLRSEGMVEKRSVGGGKAKVKVAILHGGGCSNQSIGDLLKLQAVRHDQLDMRLVHPRHLVAGRLTEFDVFVSPGGTAKYQWPWLGEGGRNALKTFVGDGGGFLGICAGAFLARVSDGSEPQRLGLASVVHRAYAKRPKRAKALCSVTPSFRSWSGFDEYHLAMEYAAGPMLYAVDYPGLPPVEPLANYESWPAGPPGAGRVGALAALRTTFGRGRVLLYSPHPEHTRGLEELVVQSLLWAAGQENFTC
jgi:glutamine amidotransferase-like uncharacterized protein